MGIKKEMLQCAYCERQHRDKQIWNSKLNDYVCMDCAEDLELQEDKK